MDEQTPQPTSPPNQLTGQQSGQPVQQTSSESPTQYAGFGRRFLAYCVDFLILFAIGLSIQQMLGRDPFAAFQVETIEQLQTAQQSAGGTLATIVSLAFGLAYFLIFWVNYDGATPGKKLLAIKIIKDDGSKVTYPVAFIRYIGFFVSSFVFFLGYLWVIWDRKKQAWHDKIAGTVVVKTDKQPRTLLAVILTLLAILFFTGYMAAIIYKGVKLGIKQSDEERGGRKQEIIQEKLQQTQERDQDKILSFAPSVCGLLVPVPKTTDTYQGKNRKWLYEEIALNPSGFYVLDKDVYPVKELNGSFIGYKEETARLGGETFNIAFPGLNIFCVDNTRALTLEEYRDLALTNKKFKVTTEQNVYWGEVNLIPVWVEGVTDEGKQLKEPAYLGVSKDGSKLLYIRIWAVSDSDPIKEQLSEEIDIITRNLRYRESSGNPVQVESKSNINVEINTNVKGANVTLEEIVPD